MPMFPLYIPINNLLFQSTFDLLLSILWIKLLSVLCKNWSVKLSWTWWHTLFFPYLKFDIVALLCWVIMLASCKLEIIPAMLSWGKLLTLHFKLIWVDIMIFCLWILAMWNKLESCGDHGVCICVREMPGLPI
jgi:hypothetical protein